MQTSSRYPWGKGTPRVVRVNSVDDSDVTITVPAGKIWQLFYIVANILTQVGAGARLFNITISNATPANLLSIQTAAIAVANYGGARLMPALVYSVANFPTIDLPATNTNGAITENLPRDYYLLPGYTIHVWDAAAISPATDDITIVYAYVEYDE